MEIVTKNSLFLAKWKVSTSFLFVCMLNLLAYEIPQPRNPAWVLTWTLLHEHFLLYFGANSKGTGLKTFRWPWGGGCVWAS